MKTSDLRAPRGRHFWYNLIVALLAWRYKVDLSNTYSITLYPREFEVEVYERPYRSDNLDLATNKFRISVVK